MSEALRISVPRKLFLEAFDLFVRAMFKIDKFIARLLGAANEFVQLQLDSFAVSVLTVLDEKDGKERHQRRSCIYDELPSVRIMKERTGGSPHDDG